MSAVGVLGVQQGGLPVIKQLLLVYQHWQSLSVRAELLCTAGQTLSALGFLPT